MSKKHYPEVSAKPDFPKLEKEVLAYWDVHNTFQKTMDARSGAPEFVMYDGPAFANGMPHYGHILTAYAKDLVPRYQTMRGKFVPRNIGWDCHGLPTEQDAEKYLNISGRQEIIEFGIEKFNAVCRERVTMFEDEWEKIYKKMGRWIEYNRTWRTMDMEYMESVMWAFKQLYDKGLIYEGKYSIWYSYGTESTVSNSETKQDDCYREREDTAVTVMFELNDTDVPTYILAWTTTPWTLVSNFALCVGGDVEYAVMEEGGKHYIIGDAAREKYKKQLENATLVKVINGHELVGKTYVPLFDFFKDTPGAFKIVANDFVTTDTGTGVVHLAPFGEEDLVIMQEEGISWHAPVDGQGKFTKQVAPYAGMLVFDAIVPIIDDLKKSGKLVKREQFKHAYPHCWRTRVPLISMPLNSWYVDVPKFRERSAELNKGIAWIPENVRDGQMGKWLEGARPWAISRSRFFGSPLPIWQSDNPEFPRTDVYGSLAEMESDFGQKIESLHRPYIDNITRPNPDDPSGKSIMRRVPDVLDCWFESGAAPFASIGFPFRNNDWFDKHFPSDFVVEYISQTRGWFYTLMNLATPLFDKKPFKTAICHGVVLDERGLKLSKSLRNYVDPTEVMDNLGSDTLRWFLMGSPILTGGNLVIDKECKEIAKTMRQVIMPLWSSYYFFTLYANAESVKANEIKGSNNLMDKYILSKMRTMVMNITELLDKSHINECAPHFTEFMDVLNNWYI
ncbi:MAG: isoleucine--tRNA ligase, partial [Alphaproteobacteria bacterium]|nr:isoleucine--tRNA ligase [Alphaproteobacteria bacterium]